MTRHHTISFTARMWEDKDLRDKVRKEARAYAGAHPGVIVVVRRAISLARQETYYSSSGRGRKDCLHCHQPFRRHTALPDEKRYRCPDKSYYEVVAKYVNWAGEPRDWT